MNDGILEAAALWLQQQSRDDMDWDGFTAWLEADPRHREAYDDIALLDERVDAERTAILARLPANDGEASEDYIEARSPARRPYLAWGGIAAALLVAVTAGGWWASGPSAPATTSYAAAAGQTRTVAVADGATATLAGGSRLDVAKGAALTLAGSAYFDVRHDPARPLTVKVSGFEVRDVGTRFDINSDGKTIRIAVAEGKVSVSAPGAAAATEVTAGHAVLGDVARRTVTLETTAPASVGAWRTGRFIYDQVPLSLVAADIARYTGHPVTVAEGVAQRRFSGVLAPGDRDSMVASVRQLAGVSVRREGDAVLLGGTGD
ncbi:FecR domain-containing protein [Sphingomonas sp.]|uniref:FecR family protein n=1 Tax=Sphingomonas sp. TaxID=28214 RepID=UPI0025DB75E6|nr:FecR domain-containing protein [Sphingomonas sp.]